MDNLTLSGGYTYATSDGDVASGLIAQELGSTIDGSVDTTLQSLLLDGRYDSRRASDCGCSISTRTTKTRPTT